jgi:hypothetical protein
MRPPHVGARSDQPVRSLTTDGTEAMRKIRLEAESLKVESFTTALAETHGGTVVANFAPTNGHNVQCGSAYDACHTGLCTPNCAIL